jgi:PAS domain S-box-containing protein
MGIRREAGSRVDAADAAHAADAAPAGRAAPAGLDHGRHDGTATAVLDFAATQLLHDDTPFGVLPAVLERLAGGFGLRAALAFQPDPGQLPTMLAAYPADAADPALLARIGALSLTQRKGTGPVQLTVEPGEGSPRPATHLLLAYSAPVGGQCLCALALIGDGPAWDDEICAAAHAMADLLATQIRYARVTARLADRQALTRALIERSPAAILAMDTDGALIECNPAAEELSGYRHDDVLGRQMADLMIPERDRSRFREHIKTYVRTGDPGEFTGQMRVSLLRADGAERVVELTPAQLTVGGRTVFTGFLRDLTELERSYDALADQTERLNCLIATAIPGVLITDEDNLVTHVSQSFCAMFGLGEPGQLIGTSAVSVLERIRGTFTDPGDFIRRIAEAAAARQPVSGEQAACVDGRTLECDYWPLMVDGRYRGDLWLAWDMSERTDLEERRQQLLAAELAARRLAEQAQRQLEEQNERLKAQDEARNQFLAVVSHELRTPLTSIVSFAELIRGEAEGLTPDGIKFLEIIERNADRLYRLIGDLLMLDRLEAGVLPLDMADVDIAELTNEAVGSAYARAAKQGITIEAETEEGPSVPGDQKRLMQVLDNLIANAVKFSHRGGLVRVTAACQDRTWRIDVTDSGIGIPPGEASYLFSRFVRASNARTSGVPGTGLGLSIVKTIVEMHQGRIEVRSALGEGSTFSVHLPAPAPEGSA